MIRKNQSALATTGKRFRHASTPPTTLGGNADMILSLSGYTGLDPSTVALTLGNLSTDDLQSSEIESALWDLRQALSGTQDTDIATLPADAGIEAQIALVNELADIPEDEALDIFMTNDDYNFNPYDDVDSIVESVADPEEPDLTEAASASIEVDPDGEMEEEYEMDSEIPTSEDAIIPYVPPDVPPEVAGALVPYVPPNQVPLPMGTDDDLIVEYQTPDAISNLPDLSGNFGLQIPLGIAGLPGLPYRPPISPISIPMLADFIYSSYTPIPSILPGLHLSPSGRPSMQITFPNNNPGPIGQTTLAINVVANINAQTQETEQAVEEAQAQAITEIQENIDEPPDDDDGDLEEQDISTTGGSEMSEDEDDLLSQIGDLEVYRETALVGLQRIIGNNDVGPELREALAESLSTGTGNVVNDNDDDYDDDDDDDYDDGDDDDDYDDDGDDDDDEDYDDDEVDDETESLGNAFEEAVQDTEDDFEIDRAIRRGQIDPDGIPTASSAVEEAIRLIVEKGEEEAQQQAEQQENSTVSLMSETLEAVEDALDVIEIANSPRTTDVSGMAIDVISTITDNDLVQRVSAPDPPSFVETVSENDDQTLLDMSVEYDTRTRLQRCMRRINAAFRRRGEKAPEQITDAVEKIIDGEVDIEKTADTLNNWTRKIGKLQIALYSAMALLTFSGTAVGAEYKIRSSKRKSKERQEKKTKDEKKKTTTSKSDKDKEEYLNEKPKARPSPAPKLTQVKKSKVYGDGRKGMFAWKTNIDTGTEIKITIDPEFQTLVPVKQPPGLEYNCKRITGSNTCKVTTQIENGEELILKES